MMDYAMEMKHDYQRGWERFERREKRRELLRRFMMSFLWAAEKAAVVVVFVFFAAVVGTIFLCAALPDYECAWLFHRLGLAIAQ